MHGPVAYYNEIDPYAAQWLRNLIAEGHIAPGIVDTRSIEDVRPEDLLGFTQCHFFAGLGGWAHALDLAGWPRDRPVWTGSCPCQPFSAAGKGAGFEDERHLWPAWQHLIAQCGPPVVFGEQVASKAAEPWIDLVHADVEGLGYAFGCIPYPAAGVGAPHIRDRNYWVAYAAGAGQQWGWAGEACYGRDAARLELERLCDVGGLGDTNDTGSQGFAGHGGAAGREESRGSVAAPGIYGGMADANGGHASAEREQRGGEQRQQPEDGRVVRVANSSSPGLSERERVAGVSCIAAGASQGQAVERGSIRAASVGSAGPTNGLWRAADWLLCTDGKWRPVEPGTFPLAHGVSGRVGRLRAYGNAIVPQQAAEFVEAFAEAVGLTEIVSEAMAA